MSPISPRIATAPLLRRQVVTTAPDDRQGLDPGAIAGIVIGSIVGVLLVMLVAVLGPHPPRNTQQQDPETPVTPCHPLIPSSNVIPVAYPHSWIVRSCAANRLGSPPQQRVGRSGSRPRSRSRHSSYSVYPEDDYHHRHHQHHRRHHDGHRHHSHSAGPRHHSRRRSSSGWPVMVETRAPAPVYVYETRRSRSPSGHH
ncbi:hypothetical protein GGTG_03759 [Gaeumannomyces tritici R3-111a-1]|uniref:Uncharacterized protein n=1 Tax=Gaeumannomyces tritici (strain R3-111a-1) TaxID=644352 RepID=J3NR54_GAET3|nr:hypothetical protein GGTG_03759 [Gaeumannomyces tritici R3-111a-1]EJT78660.1 hypothetical protein GGTG_03759 [Gaeumannomyces tritici R3-111a-1]